MGNRRNLSIGLWWLWAVSQRLCSLLPVLCSVWCWSSYNVKSTAFLPSFSWRINDEDGNEIHITEVHRAKIPFMDTRSSIYCEHGGWIPSPVPLTSSHPHSSLCFYLLNTLFNQATTPLWECYLFNGRVLFNKRPATLSRTWKFFVWDKLAKIGSWRAMQWAALLLLVLPQTGKFQWVYLNPKLIIRWAEPSWARSSHKRALSQKYEITE